MKKLFGTDGIRGVANQYPLTSELALSLGRALAFVLGERTSRARILIGKDTRLSGYMLETAIASGICSMGADVLLVGPMPTPGIAFLTHAMRADAGVVISASHNPFQDNGVKVFDRAGFKLSDETEEEIERLILSGELDRHRPTADGIGKAFRIGDAQGRYIEFVKSTFPKDLTLDGLKLVVDCAHGAAYQIAPVVFQELGARVTSLAVKPDGRNINDGVGTVFPQSMARKVREAGTDVGLALDGDGDRVVFADESGAVVDGDAVLAVSAEELLREDRLKKRTVVTTVMSNRALEEYLQRCGGAVVRTPVGDRYVVEMMREGGYNFGGESSGHLIFGDHSTTGDGLIASLQVLALMKKRGLSLSKLLDRYRPYPQVLKSVPIQDRKDLSLLPEVQKMIVGIEKRLGRRGRTLVRYSGTEPVVRILIEGDEVAALEEMAEELSSCLQRNLNPKG